MRDRSHVPHSLQHFVTGVWKRPAKEFREATCDSDGARASHKQHRRSEVSQLRVPKRLAKQCVEMLEHSTHARGDGVLSDTGQ